MPASKAGCRNPGDEARFRALLATHQLAFIAQIFTSGADVAAHVASFRGQLARAATFSPVLVNCHGGRDAWTAAEGQQFYAEALAVEREARVAVAHETHRGRILYNPWITRDLLQLFPDLKLSCDFSHWVCVAERLLTTEGDIIALAAERCLARPRPRRLRGGPAGARPAHAAVRRPPRRARGVVGQVWDSQAARGMTVTTLTPEFGPPLYQHTLPPSGAPVGDLAEICDWQAARQAQRFANR